LAAANYQLHHLNTKPINGFPMEEIELFLDDAKDTMEKAIKHTQIELSKIRAGKASPAMLDGIQVDYYGMMTPLTGAATVNTPDARTIAIKPFERKLIGEIEKAIRNSNIGLNPQNDGEVIRLSIPPLTEERRRDLVKRVKQEIEVGKVNIRNIRKDTNESLRKLTKEGVSEDAVKQGEERVQKLTDSFIAKIDQLFATKEADIMSV
jgi:ribosome recycling factor